MQYGQQKKLWRTWRWKRGGKIMNLTWALEELRKTIGCDEEQDCCRECKECKWHQSSETMVKAIKIAVEALSGMEGQDETNTRREKDMEKKENKTLPMQDKTCVVFAPNVGFYYADDIGRPDGYQATLIETLAANLFKPDPGITFCTKRR
jgi:hypothetical protein